MARGPLGPENRKEMVIHAALLSREITPTRKSRARQRQRRRRGQEAAAKVKLGPGTNRKAKPWRPSKTTAMAKPSRTGQFHAVQAVITAPDRPTRPRTLAIEA
ncbi:hypothetical protein GCM10022267_41990 [Lentzea roselyniae]|uniref:Uncharacterized protein n=1 Tax=Lentzea roselyniae TaxID=531940 RepID=A0ABP7B7I8_9PSEU